MTKGKKKALIITLSIVGVLVIAIAITCIVLFTRDPETPPVGGENTVYQTQPETFWSSFGSGYMSFDIIEEPAEPVEGELYGNVFKVYAFNEGEWQAWLLGTWEMSEDETTLTLTATWDENNSNATKLTDATNGEPKIYTASDGKFSIGVTYPGMDGQVTFTLDPVADKVGEGETPTPPCTEHVDANGDGKCDNCGENMPEEPSEPGELMLTLTATDAATSMGAEIELYSDNTFAFNLDYMGGKVFGGAWASSDESNVMAPITLTVDDTGKDVIGETVTINISLEGDKVKYTCHVDYIVPQTIEMSFDFVGYLGETPEPEPPECTEHVDEDNDGKCDNCGENMPEPEPEPGEALYSSNVVSIYGGQGSAYLALEEGGAFNVYVTFGGSTSSWLHGTWSMENEVLTVTPSDGASVTCPLTDKAYTVKLSLPGAEVDFVIDMDEDSVTYTVNYMLNDGTSTVYDTAEIKGNPQEAYIAAAPAAPTRDGYHFAGWQTKAVISDADIVNGVSKYLWLFGDKLSTTGVAKYAAMSEEEKEARGISKEVMFLDSADVDGVVTLYARWVTEKEISDAQGLKDISKDLYGAYKLTDDIALTGVWEPIGAYFSNYEYYNTEWWTYAFRGTLNGNGHTIRGLNITSAELNKDYSSAGSPWHDDGVTCNGTVAMFSALASANIFNLTIAEASIDVTYSGDYLYVGTLAAFDMTSALTNIKVTNSEITVSFDESELTFRDNLFTAVGGLEAGGWTNTVTGCEVSGSVVLNATNKFSHGGEIYLGGMLGENYSTMTNCKTDVTLSLNYKDEGTESEDSEIVVNVGGLSGSGTSISGCTINADIAVKAIKENGASSVNIGGIVGSQRYMTTNGNTVEGTITTTGCSLDAENGVLNVGGVGGRIDVYYMLQILAYTPIANAGAENNVQNVTVNGEVTDKIIADAISAIPGCWYIAKGDQPDYGATSNIDAVIEEYGSYLPVESLQNGIIFIVNTSPQSE